MVTFSTLFPDLLQLKHNLQANFHQSSSTTYDLYALDFIKYLLQACLCQHNSN